MLTNKIFYQMRRKDLDLLFCFVPNLKREEILAAFSVSDVTMMVLT